MSIPYPQSVLALAAVLVLGLASLALPGSSLADDDCSTGEYEDEHDHERARRAVECGEIMPLVDVLAAVRPHISGKIIDTEFEREDGVWIYELKLIDTAGHLVEIHVDARTAQILEIEGHE